MYNHTLNQIEQMEPNLMDRTSNRFLQEGGRPWRRKSILPAPS